MPDVVSLSSETAVKVGPSEVYAQLREEGHGMKKRETLVHPEYGRLPARKVLECIFALAPTGKYAHHHLEEVNVEESGDEAEGEITYTMNNGQPADGRERCQIIPPFVREFDPPEFPTS